DPGAAPVHGVAGDPDVVGGGRPGEVDLSRAGRRGREAGGRGGRLGVSGRGRGDRGRRGQRRVVAGGVEGVHRVAVGGAGSDGGVAVAPARRASGRDPGAAPVDGVAGDPDVVGGGRPGEVGLIGARGGGAEPGRHRGRLG